MTGAAIIIIVGAVLVVVGIGVTLSELCARQRQSKHPGSETKATSAAETIDALERLLKTLQTFPSGIVLVVLGIVCFAIGAAIGDTADIAHIVESALG